MLCFAKPLKWMVALLCTGLVLSACEPDENEPCSKDDPTCPDGYVCSIVPGDPGHCISEAEASHIVCGGFAGVTCPEGYECHFADLYPDAAGQCRAIAQ